MAAISVGLVLGAGGVAGGAWHAGALAALEEVGWDPRGARYIVGTSAGSGTAAVLRLGIPASDLLAGALGRPLSEIGQHHSDRAGPPIDIPAPVVGGRIPVPASPRLTLRALTRVRDPRPIKAFIGLLPEGRVPADFIADRIRRTHEQPWPDETTWICTVRLRDGERVVFGRDVVDAHLATAVQASSSIPGYFEPVEHGGERYIDGGAHSPTNADLLAGTGLDLVVVSSPMSATRDALRRWTWTGARPLHSALLSREVRRIRDAGTPVLVLQPDADVVDIVGLNSMDTGKRRQIAEAAHDSVSAHLRTGAVAERLALLSPG